MKDKKIIEVVATLIWDKDKFLICQRPKNKPTKNNGEIYGI